MATPHSTPQDIEPERYKPSIYKKPFSSLPNPKRIWLGTPSSPSEGLGRLSILTPEIVSSAAASEIKTGIRVGLGWDMTKLEYSQFGRQKCGHEIIPLWGPGGIGFGACFDDAYSMNPQQSSQWDGFRHYSQPRNPSNPSTSQDRVFYGGTTKEEIMNEADHRIGIQHWAGKGIAGRGILLDYALWASQHSITYSSFSTHQIPLRDLLAVAASQSIVPKFGDILFIRIGVINEWDAMSDEKKRAYAEQKEPEHAGVAASLEVLEWLWDSGMAAVAGDAISWEVFPQQGEISLHEYLLAGWGCPIGEIFDLEALAKTCKELGRYSFFITSMPLNMPGGVSSPPNAMAIF